MGDWEHQKEEKCSFVLVMAVGIEWWRWDDAIGSSEVSKRVTRAKRDMHGVVIGGVGDTTSWCLV